MMKLLYVHSGPFLMVLVALLPAYDKDYTASYAYQNG